MNILDIIILICLIPAVIHGLRKGLISQVISIASIVFGVWASVKFAVLASDWLAKYINAPEQTLKIVAFVLIMIAVFVALGLIGKVLEGVIKLVTLNWINKLAGMCFSVLKCLLILGLLAMAFDSLNETFELVKPEVIADSSLYPFIKEGADVIFPQLKKFLTLK